MKIPDSFPRGSYRGLLFYRFVNSMLEFELVTESELEDRVTAI